MGDNFLDFQDRLYEIQSGQLRGFLCYLHGWLAANQEDLYGILKIWEGKQTVNEYIQSLSQDQPGESG